MAGPLAMQQAESPLSRVCRQIPRRIWCACFPTRQLKAKAGGNWSGRRVHVIGAGAMGGDIAAWCAWRLTVSRLT